MKKVDVIPIVVGALVAVTQLIENFFQRVGVNSRSKHLQETMLLETGRILWKVDEKGPYHLSSHVANGRCLRSITGYKYCATKATTTRVIIYQNFKNKNNSLCHQMPCLHITFVLKLLFMAPLISGNPG